MEHNFEPQTISCLRWEISHRKTQEQVLEVKLPDGYPDIDHIIGSCGQCILKGKEWRDGTVGVNGGVMTKVVYQSMTSDQPECIDAWIQFQEKWDVPDRQREGSMRVQCFLKSMDARMLSERKMMVRATIVVDMEALVPCEFSLYSPGELPEDVQLLRREYPAVLPKEIGEKNILVDEDLVAPEIEQIISCTVNPTVTRWQLIGDKLSIIGSLHYDLLQRQASGDLKSQKSEIEFSQVIDLDREYGADATALVLPEITLLEYEKMDGKVRLKCGLVCQYIILDQGKLELIEDAYSPMRQVTGQEGLMEIPAILDIHTETMRAEAVLNISCDEILDATILMEIPVIHRLGQDCKIELDGSVQVLFRDRSYQLQSCTSKWTTAVELAADQSVNVLCSIPDARIMNVKNTGSNVEMEIELDTQVLSIAGQDMAMLTGIELGDITPLDPTRPSLLLKRKGDDTLWEIAKQSGSTVEAINAVNHIKGEDRDDDFVLIPVI